MRSRVLVSGIASLEEARFCAAAGVDFLGFDMDPASRSHVTPSRSREIVDWVVGPVAVGRFASGGPGEVLEACDSGGIRLAEVGHLEPGECGLIEAAGVDVIRSFHVLHDASVEQLTALASPFAGVARYLRLDTAGTNLLGGAGENLWWRGVRELAGTVDLFLAGDFTAPGAPEVARIRPFAIDVGQSVRAPDGELDFEALGALLNALASAQTD